MPTLDPVTNFAKVEASTGYNDTDTSIVLSGGDGAKLPAPATDGAFNLVWWNFTDYKNPTDDPNREIIRVTARSTDTLTVTRAQEGTSASTKNTASKTYKLALSPTKKTRDDLETALGALSLDLELNEDFTAGDLGRIVASANISQLTSDTDFGINGATGSNEEASQKFTVPAGADQQFTSVKLELAKGGSPTDNLNIRIETDSSGDPSGTLADANGTASIALTTVTGTLTEYTLNFAGTITLPAGTYHIRATRSGARDVSNYPRWGYQNSDVYSGGNKMSASSGVWSDQTTQDFYFQMVADTTAYAGKVVTDDVNSFTFGTGSVFEAVAAVDNQAVWLSDDKLVVTYRSSNTLRAVVGTLSNGTWSWGSPVQVQAATIGQHVTAKIDTDKFAVFYRNVTSTERGECRACTVSGTTITVGSSVNVHTANTNIHAITQLGTDKFVITYAKQSDQHGIARVATVSGTTITLGTELDYHTPTSEVQGFPTKLDTDKFAIGYKDDTDSGKGKIFVCTVSGTTITSFKANQVTFEAGTLQSGDNSTDGANYGLQIDTDKIMIMYSTSGSTDCRIVTVSSTTPTVQTELSISASSSFGRKMLAPLNSSLYVMGYADGATYKVRTFTISGNDISVNSESSLPGAGESERLAGGQRLSAGSTSSAIVERAPGLTDGDAVEITLGSTDNRSDFAIVAKESGTSGQTKAFSPIGSVNPNQSGMTPGALQYIDSTGALTETAGNFLAGRALTTTQLLLGNQDVDQAASLSPTFITPGDMEDEDAQVVHEQINEFSCLRLNDNQTILSNMSARVPAGATGISSITVRYYNTEPSTNLYLRFRFSHASVGGAVTTQTDDPLTQYATPANDNYVEEITIPASAYSSIPALTGGDQLGVGIWRDGGGANDTYNANWLILGVTINWS